MKYEHQRSKIIFVYYFKREYLSKRVEKKCLIKYVQNGKIIRMQSDNKEGAWKLFFCIYYWWESELTSISYFMRRSEKQTKDSFFIENSYDWLRSARYMTSLVTGAKLNYEQLNIISGQETLEFYRINCSRLAGLSLEMIKSQWVCSSMGNHQ